MSDRFIFLDRDGTMIKDKHYLHNPQDIEFLPYAIEGLLGLQKMGYRFVIVTNQAGVARGYFSFAQANAFNRAVVETLGAWGVRIEKTYMCTHHPEFTGECECRKPNIGLARQAAAQFGMELHDCVFIGDKDSDTQFGKNCGGRTFRIENHQYETVVPADFTVTHLSEVVEIFAKGI